MIRRYLGHTRGLFSMATDWKWWKKWKRQISYGLQFEVKDKVLMRNFFKWGYKF